MRMKGVTLPIVCGLFCSLLSCGPAAAQGITVTNVSYSIIDSNVVVHYDLNGPPAQKYRVRLILRRESQSSFKFLPISVSGDIGTGTYEGLGREIVWHLYKDVPYGFDGNDFYFEVNATLLRLKGGISPWVWILGGAAVIGAADFYFGPTIFGKPGGQTALPGPPGRP